MSQRVDEIRNQIHDARSDGYTKDELTILVGSEYYSNLMDVMICGQKNPNDSLQLDGVPVIRVRWLDDSMMVIGGHSDPLSGSSLGSLGLAERHR